MQALEKQIEAPWDGPVRAWREKHADGKVIGCFPVYSPFELIHAAGCLPLGVFGGGTQVELMNADARFVSFVCSIAKTTLELGFQKKLASLDGLFFHSICDVARNLSSVCARNFPELWVEYVHLPQNPSSAAGVDYYVAELGRLRAKLEKLTGRSVTDDALRESIALYNAGRDRLSRLYAFRNHDPDRLPARELSTLVRSFTCTDPGEAILALDKVLDELPKRAAVRRDRIRVLVEGAFCEQPPMELLEVIEEAGCAIVDDDLARGWRMFDAPVAVEGDPLRNLAEAYIHHSVPSSVRHDWIRKRELALVDRVRGANAQAVIFLIAKFCEPGLFDYVPFKDELEKAGIPHLLVEFEEKMWTFERMRGEVETFAESLLFD